jgi:hypothetical protein
LIISTEEDQLQQERQRIMSQLEIGGAGDTQEDLATVGIRGDEDKTVGGPESIFRSR